MPLNPSVPKVDAGDALAVATNPAETVSITAASLPLPTGASTEATLAAVLTDTNDIETSVTSIDGKIPPLGQAVSASSVPVVIASDQSAILTKTAAAVTATLTNVASSATNVTLLASNASRRMVTVYNDSTKGLFLKFGATASSTSFTVRIDSQSYFEFPNPMYQGQVDGIWSAANGSARITELT